MLKPTQPLFIVMIAALLCLGAVGARADALMTGKTLLLLCASKEKDDQIGCQSYIAGVVDYHNLLRSLGTAPSVNYCLPQGLTMTQMKAVVARYLIQRTEHQDFIAAPAVAMALYNAYPCPKPRARRR